MSARRDAPEGHLGVARDLHEVIVVDCVGKGADVLPDVASMRLAALSELLCPRSAIFECPVAVSEKRGLVLEELLALRLVGEAGERRRGVAEAAVVYPPSACEFEGVLSRVPYRCQPGRIPRRAAGSPGRT